MRSENERPRIIRHHYGELGRTWVLGDEANMSAKGMSKRMAECIDTCFEKWTPRKRVTMYKVEPKKIIEQPGVII